MNYIKKSEAYVNYEAAKADYFADPTQENWIKLCDAKRVCMLLGILI